MSFGDYMMFVGSTGLVLLAVDFISFTYKYHKVKDYVDIELRRKVNDLRELNEIKAK